jgi:hypothetical protein
MKEFKNPQITQITQISFFGLIERLTIRRGSGSTNAANSLIAIHREEKSA